MAKLAGAKNQEGANDAQGADDANGHKAHGEYPPLNLDETLVELGLMT